MEFISYLSDSLNKDTIIRWPESSMPLKIYVAPFRWYKAKEQAYSYKQMVFDALNIWKKASNNKISFKKRVD